MGNEGKLRISLVIRMLILFLIAMALSFVILLALNNSRNYLLEVAADQGGDVAKAAATAAMIAISSEEDLERLYYDESFREKTHETYRFICERTGLSYLYLYTVDEEEKRHYIICAAPGDEEDEMINESLGFGTVSETPLHDSEKVALYHDVEGDYEFVNNKYGNVCMYSMPVANDDGEVVALIGADYSIEHILSVREKYARVMRTSVLIVFGFTLLIALILIRQTVLRPIRSLSDRMRNFIKYKNTGFEGRKTVFEDEISDMEESFREMAEDISKYVG